MRARGARAVAGISTVVVLAGVAAAPAWAASGPGTFTKITTPSNTVHYRYDAAAASNGFTVSGITSANVTSVDIVCTYWTAGGPNEAEVFATDVPVGAGMFSTMATYDHATAPCRLRAVPSGVDDVTDDLSSYTGPLVYTSVVLVSKDGGVTYTYTGVDERGTSLSAVSDAGSCGVVLMATFNLTRPSLFGPGAPGCALALPGSNIPASGDPTKSAIVVDNRNAYLPKSVNDFRNPADPLPLAVSQSPLTVHSTIFSSGDMRIIESAPLMRCSVSNLYPPTTTSCPSLVVANVTFKRVVDVFRGGHQIRFRDSWTSSNGAAHTVAVQYETQLASPETGAVGYAFPGHNSTFARVGPGKSITSFGSKAGTMLVRSNVYAAVDDPGVDTYGFTWSRPPTNVQFGPDSDSFAFNYSFGVPAKGGSDIGFAASEAPLTASLKPLTGAAGAEMVSSPVVSSPKNHATIKGTKTVVKGKVTRGANGLPRSVTVNGHKAKLTATTTGVNYAVSFREKAGRHTIKVVATDAAGNTASRSIKVKNKVKKKVTH